MTTDAFSKSVRVEIDSSSLSATLHVAPGLDPALLDELTLRAIVAERGIQTTPQLIAHLQAAITDYRADPTRELLRVIAEGFAPQHGTDGRLVFEPGMDPAEADAALLAAAEQAEHADAAKRRAPDQATDHYARSVIKTVRPGDLIARLVPPSDATDGRDVIGRNLAAKPGKPFPLTTDDSVQIKPDGGIFALRPGRVEHKGHLLRISDRLIIPGPVDFSTGHVEFTGHLLVRRGVRDFFRLTVGRSLTVQGLVEGAIIEVKLDAVLEGGMAARGQGQLAAGRDAKARYLDSVKADIARDLAVENEIIASDLTIGRSFIGASCSITGGTLTAGNAIEVSTLGSEAGVPTTIYTGSIPTLQALLPRLDAIAPEVSSLLSRSEANLKQLQTPGARLSPRHAEELTELEFEVSRIRGLETQLSKRRGQVTDLITRFTDPVITIRRHVYPGTRIHLGHYEILFTHDAKGPVRLRLDPSGRPQLIDLLSNEPADLARFARVRRIDESSPPNPASHASANRRAA